MESLQSARGSFCLATGRLLTACGLSDIVRNHWKMIMTISRVVSRTTSLAIAGLASMLIVAGAQAQSATEIQLSYKDKKFDPAEISAPANTPIVIKFKNLDAKAMEFESKTLKVEKVVAGGGDATINIRAQKSGRYEFFDEYNEKVARGALVVK
jgi:hypothetical protein